MNKLYTATATAEGGREGKVTSSDGVIDLELRVPKELGGPGGHATNPEQLFAAGYAACFDSALKLIIRTKKVQVESTKVTASITIGKDGSGGYELAAKLDVSVNGVEADIAKELVEAAHQFCPYSKATKGNIEVEVNVV
ncbi:organic hydroperoxide resistance protein [Paenibacillus sp. Soil724D2]|uniref:organic hydroperoxide resistance protein n=1 Tax=Paenibacillus sp. (strain Soil724D2) TaxID=1736392 RepID=UPI000713EE9D|nr:organic hydroperoxide resistance protein [Paenibacillus sp. Soil724D2]KRE43187.1 Ohr subfamily peroxiredoxin [Paenibacillus sp. Soil724D2]